jgi:cytochrome c oxidase subunit II
MIASRIQLLADYTDTVWFPQSASSFSAEVDSTFMMVMWICVLFLVPITFCLFYFAIKYVKANGVPAESQTSHNTPLEIAWSVLPCFLLVAMFARGSIGYIDQRKAPEGAASVDVKAFKWGWSMDYGNGVIYPELHLVVNQPTKLTMRSSDVLHSLFVPAFRAKRDIVPGRYNEMWFLPSVASERVSDAELAAAIKDTKDNHGGTFDPERYQFTQDGYKYFDLYCTEYCGRDHSKMQTVVVVHETNEDFNAWIKKYSGRQPDQDPAEYGGLLYSRRGCASCHSIDGTKRVGPSFKDLFGSEHGLVSGENVNVDENYIRESILEPKAKVVAGYSPVMPSYKGQLSDEDINCIVAYLKTLSSAAGTTAAPVATAAAPGAAQAAAAATAAAPDAAATPAATAPTAEAEPASTDAAAAESEPAEESATATTEPAPAP